MTLALSLLAIAISVPVAMMAFAALCLVAPINKP